MSVNIKKPNIFYCSKCVYPSSSAVNLNFDKIKVCTGCQVGLEKKDIDWDQRKSMLLKIFKEYKTDENSKYDCIIPVSGG